MTASVLLKVENLSRAFGGLIAVNDLTFSVREGEIMGLIGPNGSGKTTVINLLSGALKSDRGRVELNGTPIHDLKPHKIARRGLARTFQLARLLPSMSCLENVIAGMAFTPGGFWGREAANRARALIERVGLGGRESALPGALTYIDQKRLELARALAASPEILLLDEWLAGLNPAEMRIGIALLGSMREEGRTILLVEHVMDAIRSLCDRCVVMNAGRKIAEGTPQNVLSDKEVMRAYLGDENA